MVKKGCFTDNDCGEDKMCIFDYDICKDNMKCQNICINKKDYYNNPKCVNNNIYNKLNSTNINKNIRIKNKKDCIDWAKKQECSKNNTCNSIIYRHKKHSIIDKFKGFVHVITGNTKHKIETDNHKKLRLYKKQHNDNNHKDSKIQYSYQCTNNGGSFKSDNMRIKDNLNISCPVNKNDEKFKNICATVDINNSDITDYNNLDCDFNHHVNYNLPKSSEELLEYDNKKNELIEEDKKNIINNIIELKNKFKEKYNTVENFKVSVKKGVPPQNITTNCSWEYNNDDGLILYSDDKNCDQIDTQNSFNSYMSDINSKLDKNKNTIIALQGNIIGLGKDKQSGHGNKILELKNLNKKIRREIEEKRDNEKVLLNTIKYLLIILSIIFIITIIYFIFKKLIYYS